jgi:hypothetical protein
MLVLNLPVPRHLDSSLIDVDVHPTYVSIIIKGKTLRLRTLCEVKADDSKCQRAKTDGKLMVIMPKVNVKENILTSNLKSDTKIDTKINPLGGNSSRTKRKGSISTGVKKLSMQEQMIVDAMEAAKLAGKTSASTSNGPDSSLLHVGNSATKGSTMPDVSNIVRKRNDEKGNEYVSDEIETTTVFDNKVSLIEQID